MDNKTDQKISSTDYNANIFDKLGYDFSNELTTEKNIFNILNKREKCLDCDKNLPIKIKKFKKIEEQIELNKIDNEFGRCHCGKRHIDIVMTHVLKIMKEENIELKRFNLRNGPIPLLTPMTNQMKGEYIEKDSLVILHSKLTKNVAEKILKEVSEVKGVVKGDSKKTVGIIDSKSEENIYELVGGNDFRCDIIQTPTGNIIINKIQHLSYLEFPNSIENKIMKLCNYLKTKHYTKKELSNLKILDGTCGNGTLGIFLLKLGVKKVVFNDIWKPSTMITSINLESNGFKTLERDYHHESTISLGNNFKVFNFSIEDLIEKKYGKRYENNYQKNNYNKNGCNEKEYYENEFDICILDCFPNANIENFKVPAKIVAKDVFIM